MADFSESFRRYLWVEDGGKYYAENNSATDAGGLTIGGISSRYNPMSPVFAIFVRQGARLGEISPLNTELINAIKAFYQSHYIAWRLCDIENQLIADQVFQAAENIDGGKRAKDGGYALPWSQTVTNMVVGTSLDADGVIGDLTIAAINSVDDRDADWRKLYGGMQRKFYENRAAADPVYGAPNLKGWLARVEYFL